MKSILIEGIKRRINEENRNWLALIVGATGSGKTYSACAIAERIDPNFTIDNVVFSPKELMSRLNSGQLRRGSALIFEEAGVNYSSRSWYEISNKLLGYIFQASRNDNYAFILTTPNAGFIDSQMRKLLHNIIETVKIDRVKQKVIVKWLNVEPAATFDKVYRKYPRIRRPDGRIVIVNRVEIAKPSDALIAAYELKKRKFVDNLKLEAEAAINRVERVEADKTPFDIDKTVEEAKQDKANFIQRFVREYNSRRFVDVNVIRHTFKISKQDATVLRDRLEVVLLNP